MGILLQAPPAIAAPQATANNSLVSVVPNLYWSVAARGPLLIIGAEKYKQVTAPTALDFFGGGMGGFFGAMGGGMPDFAELMGQKKPQLTPLGTPPREGWNPTAIAAQFGAQVVRVGGVSVLAPLLLPDKSKSDSPFGGVDFADMIQEGMAMGGMMGGSRLLPLLASLTPNQLQQASSSSGLPLASLDNQQKTLLQPLMRRTMPFRFDRKPNIPQAGPLDPAPVIPQSDQNQFRLRLTRALNIAPSFPETGAGGQGARMSMRIASGMEEQTGEVRSLALKGGKQANPLAMLMAMGGGQNQKGVPARKKPTDLNTDTGAMNASVSLMGVTTVDELVTRIATVTKVPLFADQRVGKLKVSARGTTARAGDLVQALCWAVGGAVRRISDDRESVYLLTEEVAIKKAENPMTAMMGPISGMMQDQKSAERKAMDAKARLIRQKVLSGIPRGRGAELGARLWQIAEAKPAGDNNMLGVGELPPDLRARMEDRYKMFSGAIASIPEGVPGINKSEPQPLSQVRCSQDLVAELVAPSLGAVATLASSDANEIHPDLPVPTPPASVALPESIKQRVVAVPLPADEAAAKKLVDSAVARGLTELRVVVPVLGEAALATLGTVAKGKIAVVAVLAPLEPLTPEAPRDKSWAGQSLNEWLASPESQKLMSSMPPQLAPAMTRMIGADYLTPEGADVTGFVARVKRLLALPGVTGYALERLAAPGYRSVQGGGMSDGMMFFWQGGANSRERVAFTKDQKSDAAELSGFNFMDMLNPAGPRGAWTKRTTARSEAFIKRLDTALTQAKLPAASVLSGSQPARWEKWTGKFPTSGGSLTAGARPALTVISYTQILAQPGAFGEASEFAGFDEPEQFTGVLRNELKKLADPEAPIRWDGLVLDLADQNFDTALAILERAVAPKS
jgi:hypothetical protein